jgi:hypothetical protein
MKKTTVLQWPAEARAETSIAIMDRMNSDLFMDGRGLE